MNDKGNTFWEKMIDVQIDVSWWRWRRFVEEFIETTPSVTQLTKTKLQCMYQEPLWTANYSVHLLKIYIIRIRGCRLQAKLFMEQVVVGSKFKGRTDNFSGTSLQCLPFCMDEMMRESSGPSCTINWVEKTWFYHVVEQISNNYRCVMLLDGRI